jgi:DNA gyrase subunit A
MTRDRARRPGDIPARFHRRTPRGGWARRRIDGRGRVIVRAKYEIEELKDGRAQIVFTEIPYQLTKEMLLKRLAELVNSGRITGVSNIDDFSDRNQPVRIVVTVKNGEDPNVALNQLFEYSPLQDTFSVIMLALVDARPKTPLLGLLRLFVDTVSM